MHQHGIVGVTFGELFDDEEGQQFFEAIVGTLRAAKKRGVVDFKGQVNELTNTSNSNSMFIHASTVHRWQLCSASRLLIVLGDKVLRSTGSSVIFYEKLIFW